MSMFLEPGQEPPRRSFFSLEPVPRMTAEQVGLARTAIGHRMYRRALSFREFGQLLRIGGQRPDQSIRDYESGSTPVPGPVALAIELLFNLAFAEATRALLDAVTVPSSPDDESARPVGAAGAERA